MRASTVTRAAAGSLVFLAGIACSDDGAEEQVVRLVTHESFVVSDGVLEVFTEQTGIRVEVLRGDDAGSVVNQAVLTRDDPQGDVLYGIDTTFLTLGLDEDLFEPYESPALDAVSDEFDVDPEHRVTPIDRGDVCINYDRSFFEAPGAPSIPDSLAALADPAYRDLLVVEDPATSSPGLAFLAATVEELGDDGWEAYWAALRANGVKVANDWTDAYYGQFSGGATSEGDRPLVVSYASSPPAEVVFADPPVDEPPTGVVESTCIRQVEYAGVLTGAAHPEAARQLIDFLLSETFQADVPLTMFVFPVRDGIELPEVFTQFAAQPADAINLDPFALGERRAELIKTWTDIVLR